MVTVKKTVEVIAIVLHHGEAVSLQEKNTGGGFALEPDLRIPLTPILCEFKSGGNILCCRRSATLCCDL